MLNRPVASYRRWQRSHRLASLDRAGRWSRHSALRLQYDYARRAWRALFILIAVMALASLPAVWLSPWWAGFTIGSAVATTLALAVLGVILGSGTAPLIMGGTGEQWTAEELRPLRRHGWRVLHNARLRFGDIDHVAIGTPGVVVLETKWRREQWNDSEDAAQIIHAAVAQVQRNAHDVELTLRSKIGRASARSAVVLWSASGMQFDTRAQDGVVVLPGTELRQWMTTLAPPVLNETQIEDAWQWLATQVERRDTVESARCPPPLTVTDALRAIVAYAVGAAAGVYTVGLVARWDLLTVATPALCVVVAASYIARRHGLLPRLLLGFLAGAAGIVTTAAIVAIISLE